MANIAVIVTTTEKYPNMDRATGIWLGEAVHFVDKVVAAGHSVDYLSPLGGYTPIDPHSLQHAEPIDWQWYRNREFMNALGATRKVEDAKAEEYQAIYYVGGHGVIWDFPDNQPLARLAAAIYQGGGLVSSVCHGAAGLLNIRLDNGDYLVAGKTVTGFSNEEERLAELDQFVPFLTEDELVKRGAHYVKAETAFAPFAVEDARVITGQNPASGGKVGALVVKALA